MGTLANPGKDCYNQALPHEERFTLLARDPCAAAAIRYWIALRTSMGANKPGDEDLKEALECANRMELQHHDIRKELGKS